MYLSGYFICQVALACLERKMSDYIKEQLITRPCMLYRSVDGWLQVISYQSEQDRQVSTARIIAAGNVGDIEYADVLEPDFHASGNRIYIDIGYRDFERCCAGFSSGNVSGMQQLSSIIRPRNELMSNGVKFEYGKLQQYDLMQFSVKSEFMVGIASRLLFAL